MIKPSNVTTPCVFQKGMLTLQRHILATVRHVTRLLAMDKHACRHACAVPVMAYNQDARFCAASGTEQHAQLEIHAILQHG